MKESSSNKIKIKQKIKKISNMTMLKILNNKKIVL